MGLAVVQLFLTAIAISVSSSVSAHTSTTDFNEESVQAIIACNFVAEIYTTKPEIRSYLLRTGSSYEFVELSMEIAAGVHDVFRRELDEALEWGEEVADFATKARLREWIRFHRDRLKASDTAFIVRKFNECNTWSLVRSLERLGHSIERLRD